MKPNILWGISASVAAIRAPNLAEKLLQIGAVRAMITDRAKHFVAALPREVQIDSDADEWSSWKQLGDPVLHIELRRWADIFVIAPLSADLMAKLAGGICDNLLLSVARAWDYNKPILVAPAMNTAMWDHPITRAHLDTLSTWGVRIIQPVEKELACGDVGMGAMAPVDLIAAEVEAAPRVS